MKVISEDQDNFEETIKWFKKFYNKEDIEEIMENMFKKILNIENIEDLKKRKSVTFYSHNKKIYEMSFDE